MNVSAHVRYTDYTTKPTYPKSNRRSNGDALKRKPLARHENPESGPDADSQASGPAFDEDETLEYQRGVPAQLEPAPRRTMIAETTRPTPTVNVAPLWALIAPADGLPGNAAKPAPTAAPRANALFDLLDQVIAQA